MKKLVLFLIASTFLCLSCSKSDSDDNNGSDSGNPNTGNPVVKIDVNGQSLSFETAGATLTELGDTYALIINGSNAVPGVTNFKSININLVVEGELTTGEYQLQSSGNTTVNMTYSEVNNTTEIGYWISSTDAGTITISIIDLEDRKISGSFQATLFLDQDNSTVSLPAEVNISNGSFNNLSF